MAFDAANYPTRTATAAELVAGAPAPCPVWSAENPDRALAFLFVAPSDCDAVDAVVAAH